jgi:hypothetical protein
VPVIQIGAISHYHPVTYFSVQPIPPPDYFIFYSDLPEYIIINAVINITTVTSNTMSAASII